LISPYASRQNKEERGLQGEVSVTGESITPVVGKTEVAERKRAKNGRNCKRKQQNDS